MSKTWKQDVCGAAQKKQGVASSSCEGKKTRNIFWQAVAGSSRFWVEVVALGMFKVLVPNTSKHVPSSRSFSYPYSHSSQLETTSWYFATYSCDWRGYLGIGYIHQNPWEVFSDVRRHGLPSLPVWQLTNPSCLGYSQGKITSRGEESTWWKEADPLGKVLMLLSSSA